MALEYQLSRRGTTLTPVEEATIERIIQGLARRVERFPDPRVELAIDGNEAARRYDVDFRLSLLPLGTTLVSHQSAETAERATRLAADDIRRQLERLLSTLRGEATWGVPSRREPEALRPNGRDVVDLPGDVNAGDEGFPP